MFTPTMCSRRRLVGEGSIRGASPGVSVLLFESCQPKKRSGRLSTVYMLCILKSWKRHTSKSKAHVGHRGGTKEALRDARVGNDPARSGHFRGRASWKRPGTLRALLPSHRGRCGTPWWIEGRAHEIDQVWALRCGPQACGFGRKCCGRWRRSRQQGRSGSTCITSDVSIIIA